MKNLSFLTLTIFLLLVSISSANEYEWEQSYNFEHASEGWCGQQTSDGGYILTGYTLQSIPPIGDIILVKTDQFGNSEWSKIIGGLMFDQGFSVVERFHSLYYPCYVIAGSMSSVGESDSNICLIEVDEYSDFNWIRTYGKGEARCVQLIPGIGSEYYVVTGHKEFGDDRSGEIFLMKTTNDGYELWTKTFGIVGSYEHGNYFQLTADGGFIITGYWCGEICLIKTDSDGNQEWIKILGEEDNLSGEGYCVQQTSDSGFIVSGGPGQSGQDNMMLIKTDSEGNEIWRQIYTDYQGPAYSVQQTSEGGFITVGPGVLIKCNPEGNIEWVKNLLVGTPDYIQAHFVKQTTLGGYIITGEKSYSAWLYYYDPDPNQPPVKPTLIAPADNSVVNPGLVTFTWINNGDPDNDPVGSWLYATGPWNQVISINLGPAGFEVGQEISGYAYIYPDTNLHSR